MMTATSCSNERATTGSCSWRSRNVPPAMPGKLIVSDVRHQCAVSRVTGFSSRPVARALCVEPVFALDPVLDPAGEAGTRGGVAELDAERLSPHIDDLPHVAPVRAGD